MSKPGGRPSIVIKHVLVVRRKSTFRFRMHSLETDSMNGKNCRLVLVLYEKLCKIRQAVISKRKMVDCREVE